MLLSAGIFPCIIKLLVFLNNGEKGELFMSIFSLVGINIPNSDSLADEKKKEIDIYLLSFVPLSYGIMNVVALAISTFSIYLFLGVLAGSGIFITLFFKNFLEMPKYLQKM